MPLCSIAIAAGVMGVVAAVKGLFFRRRYARFGCDHHGGGGPGGGGWSRPGRSWWLRRVFSRLDTTPGQEREIRSAIEEFQRTAREAKDGLKGAREDLAKAIRGESFDDAAISDASGRADATTARIKEALANALKRVHATLDPNQRGRLAELLERGPGFGRGAWASSPYRD